MREAPCPWSILESVADNAEIHLKDRPGDKEVRKMITAVRARNVEALREFAENQEVPWLPHTVRTVFVSIDRKNQVENQE